MAGRFRNLLLVTSALVPVGFALAYANPQGAQVVGGSAAVQGQGTPNVTVTQSTDKAIINWNTFNIGTGEQTRFIQPSASSVGLNRVTGGLGPSQLYGTLTANGRIFLVNPDGILVEPGAVIDTAGFLATTNNIKNDDFMAGRYVFGIPGRPDASIVNLGTITANGQGFAALVAPGVRNTGTITATLGKVSLASGNSFALDLYGDGLIKLSVSDSIAAQVKDVATGQPLSALVSNTGKLSANGGRVELSAVSARQVVDSVINNTGVIEANSIGTQNGMIVLQAPTAATKVADAPTQTVQVSGTLSAAGLNSGETGGRFLVTGEAIALSAARIDVSGRSGGGTVLIGEDVGGGNPSPAVFGNPKATLEATAVPTATNVVVDAATVINASAKDSGDGGKVVVWADGSTSFNGTILARGGLLTGNGGFVETSGRTLDVAGAKVDTSAPNGRTGDWLLDPYNLLLDFVGASTISLNLSMSNVTVETTATGYSGPGVATLGSGDIEVASGIIWGSGNTLTLSAYRNVTVDSGVTIKSAGAGNLTLRADNTGSGIGTVNFIGTSKVDFSAGTNTVSIFYNPQFGYAFPMNYQPFVLANAAVPNQMTAYMLVNNVFDLQNIQQNLAGNYALGKNIDASATSSWNSGAGFLPMGAFPNNGFVGFLDGQSHAIDRLTINASTTSDPVSINIGLFRFIGPPLVGFPPAGVVRNIGLTNVSVTGTNANSFDVSVGGIAAFNHGTITRSYVTGSLSTVVGPNTFLNTNADSSSIGALVAWNYGTISQSFATASVTLNHPGYAGGLVGRNLGTITQSYATGSVTGSNLINSSAIDIGGLSGTFEGNFTETYATGLVTGGPHAQPGGLLGMGGVGTVANSYWDIQSTGQATSAGGIGLTTAQLKSGLPAGFDNTVWGINANANNGYPYLLWQYPIVPTSQVISGHVFSDYATPGMPMLSFVTLTGLVNGAVFGTTFTDSSGFYQFRLAPGTISSQGSQLLIYATGATSSAVFQQNATGFLGNFDLYVSYLRQTSASATLSSVSNGLSTAIGGNTAAQNLVNSLANREINATGSNFTIDQAINTTGTLVVSANGNVTATAAVNVGTFRLKNGGWTQVATSLPNFSANDFRITGGSFLRARGGDGSSSSPYQIADVYGLQGIGSLALNNNYVLANNIDASGTANWNSSAGFVPIGSGTNPFAGVLDGSGYVIDHLTIKQLTYDIALQGNTAGLFGYIGAAGTVRNLGLSNESIQVSISSTFYSWIGGLAAVSNGTIAQTSMMGEVIVSGNGSANLIAGLVAENHGSIRNSSANATITANDAGVNVGGLVSANYGAIDQSYAAGSLIAGNSMFVGLMGGLVAVNNYTINRSFSTASVQYVGSHAGSIGGLIGNNSGNVIDSYATGAVTGNAPNPSTGFTIVGGLVGQNQGLIRNSYAVGRVTGADPTYVGGLVATNLGGSVTSSYWDIQTSGLTNGIGSGTTSGPNGDATGLMSVQFKAGLPAGFDPTVWGSSPTINNGYPYLLWQSPNPTTTHLITVMVDALTKVYGSADPIFTYHITSGALVGSDTFSGMLTRVAGANVGSYAITQGMLALPATYSLTFNGANLTITRAPLLITANDATRQTDTANPQFTATGVGFVNGDGPNVVSGLTLSTMATISSLAGTYPIIPSGASASNYTISYANGLLTVTATSSSPMPTPTPPPPPPYTPPGSACIMNCVPGSPPVLPIPSPIIIPSSSPILTTVGNSVLLWNTSQWTGETRPLDARGLAIDIFPYAQIANAVYTNSAVRDVSPLEWTKLVPKEVLAQYENMIVGSGFQAGIYVLGNQLVLAFAGTKLFSLADWTTNAGNLFNLPTTQYAFASMLTKYVLEYANAQKMELVVTGHSLGGGMAAYAGAMNNVSAITFNPADVPIDVYTAGNLTRTLNVKMQGGGVDFTGGLIGTTITLDQNTTTIPPAVGFSSDLLYWHQMENILDALRNPSIGFNANTSNGITILGAVPTN